MALDQATIDYIHANFGFLAWSLSIPELANLLEQAARERWTPENLQAHLQSTAWYVTHSASQRQFDQLLNTDPATAKAKIAEQRQALSQQAAKIGATLSAGRLDWMAIQSLRDGWTAEQTQAALGAEVSFNPKTGDAASMATQYRQLARNYGVPISDQAIGLFVKTTETGQNTQDSVVRYLQDQAKSRYPSIAKQIDAGITPMQFFDPYLEDAARILERPKEAFNLDDGIMTKVINAIDPKTHELRPMSLYEAQQYYRSRPEYRLTNGANQQAAALVESISKSFGATG